MGNPVAEYPIPVVFKTMLLKNSSGRLDVQGSGFTKSVFITKGKLDYAWSDLAQDRLGSLLVQQGIATAEQIESLVQSEGRPTEVKIGRRLVDSGALSEQELYRCLVLQVQSIALSCFRLQEGEWQFHPDAPLPAGAPRFQIPLPQLIVEGVKEIDDFSHYQTRLDRRFLNVAPLPARVKPHLSSFNLEFLQVLSKCSGRRTSKIRSRLAMDEGIFWREVVMLYLLNVCAFEDTGETTSFTKAHVLSQVDEMFYTEAAPPPSDQGKASPRPVVIELEGAPSGEQLELEMGPTRPLEKPGSIGEVRHETAPVRSATLAPKKEFGIPTEFVVEMGQTLPTPDEEAKSARGSTNPATPPAPKREFGIPTEFEIEITPSPPAAKKPKAR